MSKPVETVAVIGATGRMGSEIVTALTNAGLTVTAIRRSESTTLPPLGMNSIKLNLNDKRALTEALKGQDVVISAAPDPIVFENQKPWIDAAIAAGVKRIFPSEFSTNLESPLAEGLPIVTDKVKTRRYIIEKTAKTGGKTTWTSINNGPFFEMVLGFGGLGPDFRTKTANYHNGGDNLCGASRMTDIAETIAKILKDENGLYKEAENKPVYIHSAEVSEKQLTAMAEKVTGQKFEVQEFDVEQQFEEAKTKWEQGDGSVTLTFYRQMMYGKGYGGSERFQELSWNEKVGLKTMSEAEIEEVVREAARQAGMI
ncbi:Bifunctional pinoresinol-lariciresinol reductase 2 [Colletotrichum spinosum]|uniref:Bifunctional pinoresinol-lariciresinol reductase 2 n=1 Tax=Colletotrichum spinosum TaxID=1347390 RepID=A0A4R8PXG9_9PEZI|nr:Bifunctional pinoresinol-lariciresinol reductase 2 [Colletotrichum spinosum]